MTGNNLGDDGLLPLAEVLSTNMNLKVLKIAANNITDMEKEDIAMIQQQLLKFSEPNSLKSATTTAISYLCNCLANDTNTISILDLRGNHIGEKWGESVYEMLKIRKTLASKKGEPIQVEISERMSSDLFEKIMDMNDIMDDLMKKSQKGSTKKGKKK